MRSHRVLRGLAVLLATLVVGGAYTPALRAADKVTIRIADVYVGANASTSTYEAVLKKWQDAHPDVNLVHEGTPGDDHYTKIATDLAANNVPDVFFNWAIPGRMLPFVDAGAALDVREYFAKSKNISEKNWTPAQLAAVTVKDVPYAMPIVAFKCFTFYNQAVFDKYSQKPPTTQAELLAVSKVFNDNGIVPLDTGSKGGNPGHLLYSALVDQMPNGVADTVAAATTHDVSTPAFKAAAKLVSDLHNAKVFPEDTIANGDWGPSIALYNQGKAAMAYTCPWMVSQIDPEVAKTTKLMPLPSFDGAAIDPKSYSVGVVNDIWMVNKASFEDPKKQAIIVDLLDTVMSHDVKAALVKAGQMPGWKVDDFGAYELSPLAKQVFEFTSGVPDTYPPLINSMTTTGSVTALFDAMDKVFAGQDSAAAMDQYQTALKREYE